MKRSYYSPPEKRLKGGGFESENPRGSSGPSGIPRDFAARLVVEVYATELAALPKSALAHLRHSSQAIRFAFPCDCNELPAG